MTESAVKEKESPEMVRNSIVKTEMVVTQVSNMEILDSPSREDRTDQEF